MAFPLSLVKVRANASNCNPLTDCLINVGEIESLEDSQSMVC